MMAARRPLGALTNAQPAAAAAPPKPAAAKAAVYRCDHCSNFTGSYAAVVAHEATCACAAPSAARVVAKPPPPRAAAAAVPQPRAAAAVPQPCAAAAVPQPPPASRDRRLLVFVCLLWAGWEATRIRPQPICPARPRPFHEVLTEQLAEVAASESVALVVRDEAAGFCVAGKLGNAFLKALFAPLRAILGVFRWRR